MLQERLLRLYPRAWRERYGEEFLEIVGRAPLRPQQVIDIVSGAIDAWLSADVRRATIAASSALNGEGKMLKSLMVCERNVRYTTRDSLIGAAVMIGASFLLVTLATTARRAGLTEIGDVLVSLSFPAALTLSMPFWLMKGQPWKAQTAIVGGTLMLLVAIGYFNV